MSPQTISVYPKKTFVLGIAITIIYIVSVNIIFYRSFTSTNDILRLNQELGSLRTQIMTFDETLTMSARLAASSGDAQWIVRYRSVEPKLDDAIKRAIALAPTAYSGDSAAQTDDANQKLVEMEHRSLDLAQNQNRAAAQEILASKEYLKQKEIYARGMQELSKNLELIGEEFSQRANDRVWITLVVSVLVTALIIGLWSVVFRLISGWQTKLLEINASLDQKVEDRTRELRDEKQRTIYASKMAALGEMAGGVAHEINNPLATITLATEMLIDETKDNVDCQKSLGLILITANRIGKIVLGLRAFSRDAGQDPFESVLVSKAVEDTLSFCQARFKSYAIEMKLILGPPGLSLDCRPAQISQVLINLLNNAFDAVASLDKKWIELAVTENGSFIEISVTDSGKGIDEGIAKKIMQPFFTTKGVGKGTGLGLSVSQGIVEQHHGVLALDPSCMNTRFVLKIPKIQETSNTPGSVA